MLITRLATAAVGIPVLVGIVWAGGELLTAVVAVAVAVACIELAMARHAHRTPMAIVGALAAAALPVLAFAGGEEYLLGGVAAAIGLVSAAYVLTKDPPADRETWLWSVVTALYFGALASFFVLIRDLPDGRNLVFFVLLTVWTTDTGAYFVGRAIGRHKLAPAISPNKTIEGALGSYIAGFAAVFGFEAALGLGLSIDDRVALGLILPPVIMVGDLAESAIKRALDVKDSSGLVPGHGGIADRLDSLVFAAPVVFYYLKWVVG